MKKIFTILAVSVIAIASAQTNAFKGSDFENFTDFTNSINSYGLKAYATQGVGLGVGGSASLNINATPTGNDYVFTALATAPLPTNKKEITLMVKGVSGGKSLSFNVYMTDGSYYVFNLGDLSTSPVTLAVSASNDYIGTINTGGAYVKVTLPLTGLANINEDPTKNFFAVKAGKNALFNIDIDDIKIVDGNLAVADLTKAKKSLVKNTNVSNTISFAGKSDIQILNMNGQVVKSASVNENSPLNISSLTKGVYIVTGKVDGETVSQKIIKN
ncbi:Por secretion system C-terminal sorting domain-containing protein [Halpernia humi]|uniref:Por secretion system C-terminal sorting domain-containing protein n=1 Tax=Halpernia humi TaxID=493375 RepID=A0A1H5S3C7_9FLAO|nr:T9SS type A sorting domain-containing protein [Halpernia humi]SEF44388.1 Por secretion system C-terminal sorting domain-containing protein [Halpernia humi]